ncbi:MAG: hypothetical protein ACIWVG_04585 [Gloeotrichia echinulata HAB0833]|nr:hypothetical protein [Gloeotrichia echinulata DEX184]
MNLPELPSQPVRDEDKPGYQKEIWQPTWHCFCCQDSGIVRSHLAKMVIPTFDFDRDLLPICQAPGCNAGGRWLRLQGNIDMRLTATICQELDRISREDWRKSIRRQVDIRALAQKLAMSGTKQRTENDNREVQQRKAEIEAITHEEWIAMKNAYLGQSKDESELGELA